MSVFAPVGAARRPESSHVGCSARSTCDAKMRDLCKQTEGAGVSERAEMRVVASEEDDCDKS